jgi:trk system potassium uptake protein TrkA
MSLRIVVCGAGEVGTHIASILARQQHRVTVVDLDVTRTAALAEAFDISTLTGSCSDGEILVEAGVPEADLVVACTEQDEVNLLTAAIAKALGARRTVARVEHRVFFEAGGLDYQEALGIDGMICPDYSTAQAIARILRNPGALVIDDFGQDDIEIQEFLVSESAAAVGKSLANLKLPAGSLLVAVRKGAKASVPYATTVVSPGDSVVLAGNRDVFQEARRLFHESDSKNRQVVIMSGSPIAVWLCRALQDRHCRVRLFEPDRERAVELSSKLDWVTIIQDDVVDPSVFEEEKVGQADVFVACGDDDEQNILSCVWAKNNGTRTVVAVSGRSDYLRLLKQIGIDFAFSPRNEAADEIENFLHRSPLRTLATLADGALDVYRVPVGANSKYIGIPLAEIERPSEWIIAAIRRGDECFVPTAGLSINAGDVLVISGTHKLHKELSTLFDAETE